MTSISRNKTETKIIERESLYQNIKGYSVNKDIHKLSLEDFDNNCIDIVSKLENHAYQAFIVGGAIRDLLCGIKPKDFDIATNATTEQVHALFPNSRIIGRRFKIVHILFGRHIIEVATFRGDVTTSSNSQHSKVAHTGQLLRDNVYGSIEDDVQRRDFSANALYYSPSTECIYDFTGGIKDINKKRLTLLGDAEKRFQEDPVRMLRAFRFSNKLGFSLGTDFKKSIEQNKTLIKHVSNARLFDESIKLFHNIHNVEVIKDLQETGLFAEIYPMFPETSEWAQTMLMLALTSTKERLLIGKPVTIAYIYAVILWPEFVKRCSHISSKPSDFHKIGHKAMSLLREQSQLTMIPKRHAYAIKDIWEYQFRLEQRRPSKVLWLMQQKRFRAAYDFLLLREQSGQSSLNLASWWHDIQFANSEKQKQMITELGGKKSGRRPKRKKHNASKNK